MHPRNILKVVAGGTGLLVLGLGVFSALAFNGPSNNAGAGTGALGVDGSNNVSVGTSTTQANTKFLIIASSTDTSNYAIKVLNSASSPALIVRNDGSLSVGTTSFSGGTALTVSGTIFSSNGFTGTVSATNITPGVFNGSTGGNYAVNGSFGVNTTTQVGLPASLSVYGGGYYSGNVGIGTTGPSVKLSVAGNAIIGTEGNTRVFIGGGGGANTISETYSTESNPRWAIGRDQISGGVPGIAFNYGGSGTYSYVGSNAAGQLDFYTNGTNDRMTILNGGNVGIGTTGPSTKLSVVGSADGVNVADLGTSAAGATQGSGAGVVSIGVPANVATQAIDIGEGSRGGGLYMLENGSGAVQLSLSTRAVGTVTPRLTVIQTGLVGIGTTSPAYALDVAGGGSFTQPVIVGTPTVSTQAATKGYVDTAIGAGGVWASSTNGIYYGTGNVGVGVTAQPQIGLLVQQTQNITSGGYTGVNGTISTSPASPSTAQIVGANGSIGWGGSASSPSAYGYGSYFQATTGGSASLGNLLGTFGFAVANGTGAVTNAYGVQGQVSNQGGGTVGNAYGGYFSASAGNHSTTTNNYALYAANGGNSGVTNNYGLYIENQTGATANNYGIYSVGGANYFGGNVGIGVSPSYALDIARTGGDNGTNYAGIELKTTASSAYGPDFILNGSSITGGHNWQILSSGSLDGLGLPTGKLGFYDQTANAVRMVVDTAGNVGIATTSPGYTLSVNGTGNFTQPVVVGTPTLGTQAATKAYVDTAIGAGGQWLSTTTGIYYNGGGLVGINTANPAAPLQLGAQLTPDVAVTSTQVAINDVPTTTASGAFSSLSILNQPAPTSNSSAAFSGLYSDISVPISATVNYGTLMGGRFQTKYSGQGSASSIYGTYAISDSYSTGTVSVIYGNYNNARNLGNGTANTIYGNFGRATNNSAGSVTTEYGGHFDSLNQGAGGVTTEYGLNSYAGNTSTGSTTNEYGVYSYAYNSGSGSVTNAYGGYFGMDGSNANITNAYGVYIGTLSGTNRYSLYASDVNSPSYFAPPTFAVMPEGSSHQATSTNLMSNDFETGGGSFGCDGGCSESISTDYALFGTHSIKWTSSGAINLYTGSYFVASTTGTTYTESMYIRRANGSPVTGISLYIYNTFSSGAVTATITPVGNGWYKVSGTRNTGGSGTLTLVGVTGLDNTQANYIDGWQVEVGGTATSYTFGTRDIGSAEVGGTLQVLGGGSSYFYGSLGIATTSPAYQLDVNGTGEFTQPVIVGTPVASNQATTKAYVDTAVSGGGGPWTVSGSYIYNTVSSTFVGIGTTAPTTQLQIGTATDNTDKTISLRYSTVPLMVGTTYDGTYGVNSLSANSRPTGATFTTPSNSAYGNLIFAEKVGTSNSKFTFSYGAPSAGVPTVNDLMTIFSSGNVGIGNTNATYKLDVGPLGGTQTTNSGSLGLIRNAAPADTSPYTQARIVVYGGTGVDTGNWAYFGYGSDASLREVYAKTGSGAPLYWGTSSAMDGTGAFTANMTLTTSGNLGIGTSPNTKLDVAGIILAKEGIPGTSCTLAAGGYSFEGDGCYDTGLFSNADGDLRLYSNQNLAEQIAGANATFLQPVVVGTPTTGSQAATKAYVDTAISGGGGPWTVSGSNVYTSATSSNVGIGTTAPIAKLEVSGSTANTTYLTIGRSSGVGVIGDRTSLDFRNTDDFGGVLNATGRISSILEASNDQFGLAFSTMRSGATLAESMRINAAGNVGIGTTTPSVRLEVNGNAYIDSNGAGAANRTFTLKTAGFINYGLYPGQWSPALQIQGVATSGNETLNGNFVWLSALDDSNNSRLASTKQLDFYEGTNSSTNGNLVLSLPPSGAATFQQPVVVGTPLASTQAATKGYVDTAVGAGGSWTAGSGSIYYSGGYVGIGTASPTSTYQLTVAGNGILDQNSTAGAFSQFSLWNNNNAGLNAYALGSSYGGTIFGGVSGNNQLVLEANSAASSFEIGTNGSAPLIFAPNRSAAMTVLTNGNVGIGATNPGNKLVVNGSSYLGAVNQGYDNSERFYPNVVSQAQNTSVTGAWIIHSPIPRGSNQMFSIRVHGYFYGANRVIDFTVVGYPYSGSNGTIDGQPGAIIARDITDSGTDGLNKYVGVDAAGNVAIAIGDTSTSWYFNRLSVDAWVTNGTNDYSSGWSIDQSTSTNFSWKDKNGPLFSSQNQVGALGVNTASPAYQLDVNGTARFTQPVIVGTPTLGTQAATKAYVDSAVGGGGGSGSFSTLSVAGGWTLSGGASSSLNMNGFNITGVNKLTVTTVDPVYNIGGTKYATYGPESVGITVSADGKGSLAKASGGDQYVIDFSSQPKGSDLWLFWQTIDQGQNMQNINLTLTPQGGFSELWYDLVPSKKQIVIHGDRLADFSYHLSAPRYDSATWPNAIDASDVKGVPLQEK